MNHKKRGVIITIAVLIVISFNLIGFKGLVNLNELISDLDFEIESDHEEDVLSDLKLDDTIDSYESLQEAVDLLIEAGYLQRYAGAIRKYDYGDMFMRVYLSDTIKADYNEQKELLEMLDIDMDGGRELEVEPVEYTMAELDALVDQISNLNHSEIGQHGAEIRVEDNMIFVYVESYGDISDWIIDDFEAMNFPDCVQLGVVMYE